MYRRISSHAVSRVKVDDNVSHDCFYVLVCVCDVSLISLISVTSVMQPLNRSNESDWAQFFDDSDLMSDVDKVR